MEISPQRIRTTQFKTVKRGGYDPDEVQAFVTEVADALEKAQNDSTAMEARARAAIARLQELSANAEEAPRERPVEVPAPPPAERTEIRPDEAETISRTLLLAQRTADQTMAEATAQADKLRHDARSHAERVRAEADAERQRIIDGARAEGYAASESERTRGESEVQSLLARRDFLESDVNHLEEFIGAQRERLREAISDLTSLVERVPAGLGEMRRPLLSAADTATNPGVELDDDVFAAADAEVEPPSEEQLDDTGDYEVETATEESVETYEPLDTSRSLFDSPEPDPGHSH